MKRKKIKYICSFFLIFFTFFFIIVSEWVPNNFGDISMSQIVFHLKVPMEGADNSFIYSFAFECIAIPLVLSGAIIYLIIKRKKVRIEFLFRDKKKGNEIRLSISSMIEKLILIISLLSFLISFNLCANSLTLYEYIEDLLVKSTIFEDYYVDPSEQIYEFPTEKQNLIYIYLESMETTYYSTELGGAQAENLIPELYQLATEYQAFDYGITENNGFYIPEGTGWTVGAMVGQSTGIPLKIPIDGNLYTSSLFLPGAYSIGEILEQADYYQELFIGSYAEFGGREYFYKQHGNYNIVDYYSAVETGRIDEDYYVWWGYEDEKLYEFAKLELLEIAEKEQPFNFTMLTADTHHIGGYPCPKCPDTYEDQYANVIACASSQVYEFVSWIQEQDFYENTTIVICGDHASMDPNFFKDLDENYIRKGYYVFINSKVDYYGMQSKKITTFDLFPTTVASLGISYDGNRLGLGTNLFSDEKTLIEILGWDELQDELRKSSAYYDNNILYGE